MVTPGA
jgi:hypothetical protein